MTRSLTRYLVLALVCVATGSRMQAQPTVFINEIHYDNTGTDAGEFIEIAGPAGTDLSGYSIVLYNGTGGATYDTDALSGTIPDQQNGFGTVSLSYPVNGIQNGAPDGVALVQGTTVIQFLSYEGAFTATNGPASGMVSTDIGVFENGSEPVSQSLQLVGTGTTYSDFTWSAPSDDTPGQVNTGQTFTGTSGPTIAIDNVTVAEGDAGTVDASFTVTVTGSHLGVTFDIATADGTGANPATVADGDYVAQSLTGVEIPMGSATYTIRVLVNGDSTFEPNEQFLVTLSNVNGATVADGEGSGTIVNDDPAPPVPSDVVISQVYGGGGNSGATFTNDFIELFNRGTSAVDLAGWSVQYSSASGTTWSVTPLSGSIAPGGYYLVQEAVGAGGTTPLPTPDATGTITMAAGSGKVALRDSTTAFTGACPAANTRKDLVGYGGTTCHEGTGPAPELSNTTAALRKRGGCFDSDNNLGDLAEGNPLPRNSAAPIRSCTPVPATIHEIQGNGSVSPLFDKDVITSGVVTGVKSNGFFLQTPDSSADADPATSQGLFVFTSMTPAVTAGNEVSARGTVGEFFGLTQIEASLAGDIEVLNPGGTLPAAVTLTSAILDPAGAPDQLERYEGMRMHAASLTSVAPTNEFGEIAAVLTGVARPMREPGISVLNPVPPDPTSGVPDCCIPRFDENPERILIDGEGLAAASMPFVTSNVVLGNVTGPLDFTFGAYKLLPETPPATSANMSGVPVPTPDADELTVGGFNIENFDGSETRRKKAALAIKELMKSPDIIGHIEILDQATLQTLADQLNSDAMAASEPNPAYEARLIPAGSSTQNVGFLIKTSRVRIDAVTQELAGETFINPNNGQPETLHDRPPLVLRATVGPLGVNPRPVIVVVNHLRSFIDIEPVIGEGVRVRAKRKAQAESIAQLLQDLQTANPGTAIISVGDYNAFEFSDGYTDPIAALKGMPTPDDQIVVDESPDLVDPNFVNLTDSLPATERYSFIFEGTPQTLDHVLINSVAASYATRYAIARGNADFPGLPAILFESDATRPERSSDHDMPVAYFRFPPPSADLTVSMTVEPSSLEVGGQVSFTIFVTNNGVSPAQNVVVVDHLPETLSLVSCTATGDGVCGESEGDPAAAFPLLAPGGSETVTIVAAVSCAAVDGASIANMATVGAETADPDGGNNAASALVTASNTAPSITEASASPTQLLLPLHQMVPVTISYAAVDTCGPVTTSLSVTSDEPVTGPIAQHGLAGLTSPDWQVLDPHNVRLRAERSLRGDGRVYTVTITATDAAGGTSTQSVTVTVPRHILSLIDR